MKQLLVIAFTFFSISAFSQIKKDTIPANKNFTYKGAKNKQDTINIYNQIILSAQDSILKTPLYEFIAWLSERVTNKEFSTLPLMQLHDYFMRMKLQEFVGKNKIVVPTN